MMTVELMLTSFLDLEVNKFGCLRPSFEYIYIYMQYVISIRYSNLTFTMRMEAVSFSIQTSVKLRFLTRQPFLRSVINEKHLWLNFKMVLNFTILLLS